MLIVHITHTTLYKCLLIAAPFVRNPSYRVGGAKLANGRWHINVTEAK